MGKRAGPSTELRKWFGHNPERWENLRKKFLDELDGSNATETALDILPANGHLRVVKRAVHHPIREQYRIKCNNPHMKIDFYVNYKGNCRDAFRFYEEHLGGRISMMSTFRDMPDSANLPEERKDDILHARIEFGNVTLMGADIPTAEPMRSAYLTMRVDSAEKAEKLYKLLTDGGQIFMKMQETFFASRFAMLRDRFGTSWMLLCEAQGES